MLAFENCNEDGLTIFTSSRLSEPFKPNKLLDYETDLYLPLYRVLNFLHTNTVT
jgi:hypothetical protein